MRLTISSRRVKVQVAYYEQYGPAGMQAFKKTIAYASKVGLVVIADVKRNDIGSTAAAYSNAYLGGVEIGGERHCPYECGFYHGEPLSGH